MSVAQLKIPEKLKPLFTKKKRFKVILGGRGGAKSQSIADLLLFRAQTQQIKIGCFREVQNSIEDSVHSLLTEEIDRMGLTGFEVNKTEIFHKDGGGFRYRGLNRNPDAIKSMHGFTIFWVEEAHSISADSLKKLTPTLRTEDSEIWFSLNPQSSEDPMSKRFILPFQNELLKNGYYEDDMHLVIVVNYNDNPWFPDSLEQERKWDFENLPRAEYDHVWLGHFNDTVENSIIKTEWFDACIDAHIKKGFKPRGQKILSHDPSDLGGDAKGAALRHGSVFLDVQESVIGDVNEGCDWALDLAINNNVDVFTFDADGLGVSLRRQVSDTLNGKKIEYKLFKGSESPDNPDSTYEPLDDSSGQGRANKHTFKNKRAQYYWRLRDRMYNTYRAVIKNEYVDPDEMISISSSIKDIPKMRAELCRMPRKANGNGFIQLMTKVEMKNKYRINSPNMADAMMMTMIDSKTKNDFFKELTYDTRGIY